jgi:hypothetical protein
MELWLAAQMESLSVEDLQNEDLHGAQREPFWIAVTQNRRFRRLHKRGGCPLKPGVDAKRVEWHVEIGDVLYDARCKNCFKLAREPQRPMVKIAAGYFRDVRDFLVPVAGAAAPEEKDLVDLVLQDKKDRRMIEEGGESVSSDDEESSTDSSDLDDFLMQVADLKNLSDPEDEMELEITTDDAKDQDSDAPRQNRRRRVEKAKSLGARKRARSKKSTGPLELEAHGAKPRSADSRASESDGEATEVSFKPVD